MSNLVFIGQWTGSKPVVQPVHDNYRITQGLVIGQKQDGTAIIFNCIQPCKADAIPEMKQQGEDQI